MAVNAEKSYRGLETWARRSGTTPNTDLNADMLDGKHYADMKSEWESYANSVSGGVAASGVANFAGAGAAVTVTTGVTFATSDYTVLIQPADQTSANVGEYWVPEGDKTLSTFKVYNSGGQAGAALNEPGRTTFRWSVMPNP